MTHYERIKNLSIEEMAREIQMITNWDRAEKRKAEKDPGWYINWLNSKAPDDKCTGMGSEYCKTECPLRGGSDAN